MKTHENEKLYDLARTCEIIGYWTRDLDHYSVNNGDRISDQVEQIYAALNRIREKELKGYETK